MSELRVAFLETENKKLKRENDALKLEIAELRETNEKLRQSQDEALKRSRPQPAPRRPTVSQSQTSSKATDSELRTVVKDLQDRLTVAEQVTAATQRRELVQEGSACENPLTTAAGDYEELRLHPTQEHVYAALQLVTHTGWISLCSSDIFALHCSI